MGHAGRASAGRPLGLAAARQLRSAAARHRELGLDEAAFRAAERAVRAALAGGGRLARAEVRAVIEGAGVDTTGQRGIHLLQALSLRGIAGRWTHSRALGRADRTRAELFGEPPVAADAVAEALDRYAAFLAG